MDQDRKEQYVKPEILKVENIKDITFACVDFSCSVEVPGWPG